MANVFFGSIFAVALKHTGGISAKGFYEDEQLGLRGMREKQPG
jgi:hypothetical protein